jgi:uncharacterized protein YdcH (DUF465 family)
MFAFDEVREYRQRLIELFERKGFCGQPEFKTLFEKGESLDDLYKKTKNLYREWLKTCEPTEKKDKYQLAGYEQILNNELFCINISHFIQHLEKKRKLTRNAQGNIEYKALMNTPHLIPSYYYTDRLDEKEYKSCGKLYNKLKTVKLEDALLYEMAMRYLKVDRDIVSTVKSDIRSIMSQEVAFDIKDIHGNHLYKLIVPFNKIDSYIGLVNSKEDRNFLAELTKYLPKVERDKDIKPFYGRYVSSKELRYEDLNAINSHLISNSVRFTQFESMLERYYIIKHKLRITSKNRISIKEITGLRDYSLAKEDRRNNAFHFKVPAESYKDILLAIEEEFIRKEIPDKPATWDDLKEKQAVCDVFRKTIHSNLFKIDRDNKKSKETDKELQCANARQEYVYTVIGRIINKA